MCRDRNFGRDQGPGTSRDQPGPGQGPGPGTGAGTALLDAPNRTKSAGIVSQYILYGD